MDSSARENYLETQVMTAPPQKLQLMLIDAALRSIHRASQAWQEGNVEERCEALVHAQQVMGELLAGLNREAGGDLVKKMAGIYLFVFRTLMEANYQQDQQKLNEAREVLEVERETWRQVCENLGDEAPTSDAPVSAPDAAPAAPPMGLDLASDTTDDLPASGLSLEA